MEPFGVNVKEAARLTSLSVHTIRAYCNSGKLAATRVGRRVVIPVENLSRLVRHGVGSKASDSMATASKAHS